MARFWGLVGETFREVGLLWCAFAALDEAMKPGAPDAAVRFVFLGFGCIGLGLLMQVLIEPETRR